VQREQAIDAAADWLMTRGHQLGELRFAGYAWDFRSGFVLWGGHYTRGLVTIPTLGTPPGYRLVHGWVVVFDPVDRVPEAPDDCFAVWMPEPEGQVRGRQPRSRDFEFTLPLTGCRL
jgi:hypothetical protein